MWWFQLLGRYWVRPMTMAALTAQAASVTPLSSSFLFLMIHYSSLWSQVQNSSRLVLPLQPHPQGKTSHWPPRSRGSLLWARGSRRGTWLRDQFYWWDSPTYSWSRCWWQHWERYWSGYHGGFSRCEACKINYTIAAFLFFIHEGTNFTYLVYSNLEILKVI